MDSTSPASAADQAKEAAEKTADTLKEKVIDPPLDAGKRAADTIRDGAHHAQEWVSHNPLTTAVLAFSLGLITGAAIMHKVDA